MTSAKSPADPAAVALSITTQPTSQTVTAGQTATFSVSASGTAPLSYQWRKNGTSIIGATSPTYTTAATTTSDSGSQFTVVVSNSTGNATSNTATLTVTTAAVAPSITTQPTSQTVTAGQTATFSVSASGTAPLSYQWRKNGTSIIGATSPTYTTAATTTSDSGSQFTVVVSNSTGNATSNTANLTVNPAPLVITVNPNNATVVVGNTQQFTGNVTGTSNTALTWGLSGAGCSGSSCGTLSSNADSAVYTAPFLAPSPTTVSVIATSVADPTKSASAELTIVPAVVVDVTPANVSVTAGTTQQFVASVTGTSNAAVTWALSGGCSGAACGTIDNNALYTAPLLVPSPATVIITATSVFDPTKSASADVTIVPIVGASYYLATAADGGSDSNSGLSPSAPWLTPNHALNCGDTITAAASTSYSASNFASGEWGTVTCSSGNNVAWLQCATFDACKISSSSASGFVVSTSYWGIQGWEVSVTGTYSGCFLASPPSTSTIHHIIFANDIANGCGANGFSTFNDGNASVDYIAIVGNIAYNAAQSNSECYSGISIYQPVQSDSLPGTHIYVAGNFSYKNLDPDPCAGGTPSDGEGIIFDTWDGSQGGLPSPYSAQGVAENNILVSNGGRGLLVFNNQRGSAHASIYLMHNTLWGSNGDLNESGTYCGEVLISFASDTQASFNIAATNATDGCGVNPIYAYYVGNGDSTDSVYSNVGYSASGTYGGINNSGGFSYGPNNLFGTNPSFSNATAPSAPSCGSASSVPNCMATVISNFTPTNSLAIGYGYQTPSETQTYDPLFPQWLCNVNLPSGLVTMGCLTE